MTGTLAEARKMTPFARPDHPVALVDASSPGESVVIVKPPDPKMAVPRYQRRPDLHPRLTLGKPQPPYPVQPGYDVTAAATI